ERVEVAQRGVPLACQISVSEAEFAAERLHSHAQCYRPGETLIGERQMCGVGVRSRHGDRRLQMLVNDREEQLRFHREGESSLWVGEQLEGRRWRAARDLSRRNERRRG